MTEGRLDFGAGWDPETESAPIENPVSTPAAPRFKPIERTLNELRPFCLETLIEEDHPARAIWEFVGGLDLAPFEQGILAVEGRAGQATLQPRLLIALWLLACVDAVGSARELSRRTEHHPAYRWLCGDEPINYHTLSDFRVKRKEALDQLFTEVLATLQYHKLIQLQRVAHDGTRIRAVASAASFHRETTIEECLKEARAQVEAMGDPEQKSEPVSAAQQRARQQRSERLEQARVELKKIQAGKKKKEEKQEARVSTSEPEARVMKMADRSFAPAYNAQFTTDAEASLVVNVEVTQSGSDFPQLVPALEQVKENFGRLPHQTLVDGGYMSRDNIVALDGRTDLIGPYDEQGQNADERRRRNGIAEEFGATVFVFDAHSNTFRCPANRCLVQVRKRAGVGKIEYTYRARQEDCAACVHKPRCCPNTAARNVTRIQEDEAVLRLRRKMATAPVQELYKSRARIAEFPNCWIKEKLGLRRFHVRGLSKVRMETLWHVIAYNVQQWIRLCWRPGRLQAAA